MNGIDDTMAEWFNVWTSHSSIVAQSTSGEVVHVRADQIADETPIVVWRPSTTSSNAIVIGKTAFAMREITGFLNTQQLIGVILVQMEGQQALAVTPGRYWCAPPLEGDNRTAVIIFGRTEPQGWELFKLRPTQFSLPAHLHSAIAILRPFLLGNITASRLPLQKTMIPAASARPPEAKVSHKWVFHVFRRHRAETKLTVEPEPEAWHIVRQALFSILPHSQWLEAAALLLMVNQEATSSDADIGRDPWLVAGLPDLHRFLDQEDRRPLGMCTIGLELDVIAKAGLGGTPASLGHLATTSLRKLVAPRKTCCVLATARNEGLYFLEWIAHHKAAGFDHIFVYSNMNDDGSDALLAALATAGEISWINNELQAGTSAQDKAYAHALSLLPDTLDYEWTAIIDLDEFIMLDEIRFPNIGSYLAWQQRKPTDAIGLGWLIYGPNGQRCWGEAPVVARFEKPSGDFSHTIKTICRTNLFFHSQPHFPVTDISTPVLYRNSVGDDHYYDPNTGLTAATNTPGDRTAWVAHYVFKSVDEYLWKCSRNRGNFPTTSGKGQFSLTEEMAEAFTQTFDADNVLTTTFDAKYFESRGTETRRLREISGVAPAMEKIVDNYKSKIVTIRTQFLDFLKSAHTPAFERLASLIIASE